MTTSRTTSILTKPTGEKPIPLGTLGYFTSRGKLRLHQAVLKEFKRSGISQATLARRLRKKPEVISRLLASPGNWTVETAVQILFAINGGEFEYSVVYPLEASRGNNRGPDWLRVPQATVDVETFEAENGKATANSSSESISITFVPAA